MTFFLVAIGTAMLTAPVFYAFGSLVAHGKVGDQLAAYTRLSLAVRQFISTCESGEPHGESVTLPAMRIQMLRSLLHLCDNLAGYK